MFLALEGCENHAARITNLGTLSMSRRGLGREKCPSVEMTEGKNPSTFRSFSAATAFERGVIFSPPAFFYLGFRLSNARNEGGK